MTHQFLPLLLSLWTEPHGLVVVDLYPLHLQLTGPNIATSGVNTVLITKINKNTNIYKRTRPTSVE